MIEKLSCTIHRTVGIQNEQNVSGNNVDRYAYYLGLKYFNLDR